MLSETSDCLLRTLQAGVDTHQPPRYRLRMCLPWQLSPPTAATRRMLWAMCLTLLVAAFLRATRLHAVPPGPFYDEAADGLIAYNIAFAGSFPVYDMSFTGREPLWHYAAAPLMRLVGVSPFTLHLTSFYLGMLTVAGMLALALAFFRGQRYGRWLALVAGTLAATTFWPVMVARFAQRNIAFQLTITFLLWALVRAVQRGSLGDAAWAGLWAGATAYTYTANRAVPVALALILPWLILARRERLTPRQAIVMIAVAGAVFAPFGAFLYRHPDVLTHRAGQVSAVSLQMPPDQIAAQVGRGLLAALGAFGLRGDPLLYLNVPGRPVFDPPVAALFYLGLAVVAWRAIRGPSRGLHGAAILWFAATLLPVALTTEPFHSLRSLGALPIAMLLPAIGLGASLDLIERRIQVKAAYLAGLWALALIGTGVETYLAYFHTWARDPTLYSLYDGDMADLGRWFNAHDTGDAPIYVVALEQHYQHPTMAFLARDYGRMKWAAGGETLVYPPPGRDAYVAIPRSALIEEDWLLPWLDEADLLADPTTPDGRPRFLVYHLPGDISPPAPQNELSLNFANAIALQGYTPHEGPDGEIWVTLFWRVIALPPPGDWALVVRPVDAWDWPWTQPVGIFNYPPDQWTPGETIVHRVRVNAPTGTPPGDYRLQLEWFAPTLDERLPIVSEDGGFGGVRGEIGPLPLARRLPAADDPPLPIQKRVDRPVGPLTLLGYDRESDQCYAGDVLRLALYWQADSTPDVDVRPALSLEAPDGGRAPLAEGDPVHDSYPTSRWTEGEIVVDRYALRLSPDLPPGQYRVTLEASGQKVSLGGLEVLQSERLFEPPPMAYEQSANFGERVALLGYDLPDEPATPGGTLSLRLVWQLLDETDESYTVFVHLVGPDGGIVAQHDALPRGDYPLYRWLPGEVVPDEIALQLPPDLAPGEYSIRVGFYRPEDGTRLPVVESDGPAGPDYAILATPVRVVE